MRVVGFIAVVISAGLAVENSDPLDPWRGNIKISDISPDPNRRAVVFPVTAPVDD